MYLRCENAQLFFITALFTKTERAMRSLRFLDRARLFFSAARKFSPPRISPPFSPPMDRCLTMLLPGNVISRASCNSRTWQTHTRGDNNSVILFIYSVSIVVQSWISAKCDSNIMDIEREKERERFSNC